MRAGEPGYLAVDVGTSAVRASLLGIEGSLLASHEAPTPTVRGTAGQVTVDARDCWALTASAIKACAEGHEVLAVGVSAQLGMLLVDKALNPITPVLLWSDRTAESYVEPVRAALAGVGAPVTGRRPAAELSAPRLLRLQADQPGILQRARAVLSLKDYLVACLTGEVWTDPTHAGYTLLYDVRRRDWTTSLASEVGIRPEILPPLRDAHEVAGKVTAAAAEVCGLEVGVTVAVGGPDGTVGAVGAGAVVPKRTVDIAGSTDVLVHTVGSALVDPDSIITTNVHAASGLWTVGGPTGMTGGALPWLAALFRFADVPAMHDQLQRDLAVMPIGSRGVLMDTALTGHRFPYWDLSRRGSVRGLGPEHGAAELVNAAHEGSAFLVGEGLRELGRLGEPPVAVTVVGGAARREAGLELRANAWGVPVEGVGDGLATSRGAAALASVASGEHADLREATRALVPAGRWYEPDEGRRSKMAEVAQHWRAAFSGLTSDLPS